MLLVNEIVKIHFFPRNDLVSYWSSEMVHRLERVTSQLRRPTTQTCTAETTTMWANAQRDGRPAEHRWRPLCNAAVWLTPVIRVLCSNAAKTRNRLKLAGMPQTPEPISAASGPKFTIFWGHVEETLLFNKSFSGCRCMP